MIYIFLIICICVYVFMPDPNVLGVTDSNLWMAFVYPFAHASWRHLFVNSLSLFLMFNPIFKIYEERFGGGSKLGLLFASYIGAVLAGLFTAIDIPTVGASGMAFFLLGVLLMLRPTKQQLMAYIFVVIAIIVQIFRGHSNVALHLVAFAFGCIYIILVLLCKKDFYYTDNNETR